MLTYKSLNIGQPEHLSVLLSDYTPSRQLRSSNHQLLSQPTDNTVFAGHAFSSTAPRNSYKSGLNVQVNKLLLLLSISKK